MLNVYPSSVRLGSTAFVVFQGPPNRSLVWTVTGDATLTNASTHTNAAGTGHAVLTPESDGQQVLIEVTYVP